jgi:hypothetical protein
LEVGPAWNFISLLSLLHLFPLPRNLKIKLITLLQRTPGINKIKLILPLGNLYLIAQKA